MRKGHAPFAFITCVAASLALACGGDDNGGTAGEAVDGSSGGSTVDGIDGGGSDAGRGGLDDGGGGIRFTFDAQFFRDGGEPNCPSTMPTSDDPCTAAATCGYLGGGCTCQRDGHSDAGRTWHCQEFPQRDGGNMMCAAGTANGTGCEMQGRFCSTGSQTCGCFGNNPDDRKWTCF